MDILTFWQLNRRINSATSLIDLDNINIMEEKTPTQEICPNMILDARMQALDMARELNREGVNLKIAGQAEILRDAEEVFDWLMGGVTGC